ncbi:MAG: DNA topoisomerase 4 subunit A [Thermoflexales bacterium]|nr:DNA topoisomerase 4 subunit A [Thermoflexales bacterium]MDW8292733.1 DNA topoisomerase (ATP-hydrolyzing) [Anaerolineae bacterium]
MARKKQTVSSALGNGAQQLALETIEDNRYGRIRSTDINAEMQSSYLSYAMSVIVSRALPDARDGLKPVQRRILYVMHDTGLRPDAPYRKSARIVGDVLGKYHPHGDQPVYEAMARMAQDFSMRYALIDGQGNFGSVDGDPPAAMRYTEARLSALAMEMLADLEKNTVDFTDNYDGTHREPTVLPAALPNLILNGATGIAVGMATNIPPHNLGEVVDALVFMLDRIAEKRGTAKRMQEGEVPEADVDVDELMRFIKGPDFPTGGLVFRYDGSVEGGDAIRTAYATGRGKIIVQARAHVEEGTRGRTHIIITELPYAVNKSALIERIAELVRDEKISGITDIHDESDRRGMRIVIDIAKGEDPRKVLAALYKHTAMRTSFGVIMLALVDGEPRVLPLRKLLQVFIEHRVSVVKRRSAFDLEEAQRRAHILEGLVRALDAIDAIIKLIRSARDTEAARKGLITTFKFSEAQAQAILEMPLRRLTQLDRKKLEEELAEKRKLIRYLEDLLRNPVKILGVIKEELLALKQKYGDPRRTVIVGETARGKRKPSLSEDFPLTAYEAVGDELTYVVIGANGKVGRLSNAPRFTSATDVPPAAVVRANTREMLYVIGASGRGVALSIGALPQEDPTQGQGLALSSISAFAENDAVVGAFAVDRASLKKDNGESGPYMLCVTANGMVKRSSVALLPGANAQTFTAITLSAEDTAVGAHLARGDEDVLLVTQQGMAIRFAQDEVRPMGLVAGGVVGIKLSEEDKVASAVLLPPAEKTRELVLATSDGRAKRVALKEFTPQGRAGKGVLTAKLSGKTVVIGSVLAAAEDNVTYISARGHVKTLKAKNVVRRSRLGTGDAVIALDGKDALARVMLLPSE